MRGPQIYEKNLACLWDQGDIKVSFFNRILTSVVLVSALYGTSYGATAIPTKIKFDGTKIDGGEAFYIDLGAMTNVNSILVWVKGRSAKAVQMRVNANLVGTQIVKFLGVEEWVRFNVATTTQKLLITFGPDPVVGEIIVNHSPATDYLVTAAQVSVLSVKYQKLKFFEIVDDIKFYVEALLGRGSLSNRRPLLSAIAKMSDDLARSNPMLWPVSSGEYIQIPQEVRKYVESISCAPVLNALSDSNMGFGSKIFLDSLLRQIQLVSWITNIYSASCEEDINSLITEKSNGQ